MADSVPGKLTDLTNQLNKEVTSAFLFCDPCYQDGDNKEAEGFCVECQHYLCDQCFKYHCLPIPMKHHKLLGKSEMPKRKVDESLSETCSHHEGEMIKYYCKTHGTVGCNSCMIIHHKPCLEICTLTDIAKDVELSPAYKDFCTRMETTKTNLEDQIKTARENIAICRSCRETALTEINQLQQKINIQFELQKQELAKEAEEKENNEARKLKQVEDSANDSKNFLTSALKNVDALGELCVQKEEESEEDLKSFYGNYPEYGMPRGCPISNENVIILDTIYNRVRLYAVDEHTLVTEKELTSCPWDITSIEVNKFALTLPNENKIKIMSVEDKNITVGDEINVDARCEGIHYAGDKLYVACSKPAQVLILNTTGTIIQCYIKDQAGEQLFRQPAYIYFDTEKQLICASDRKASCIVTMATDGKVRNVFRNEDWKMPLTIMKANNTINVSDFEKASRASIDLTTGECKIDDGFGFLLSKNAQCWDKSFGCVFIFA
ncbi:uncharacterized protein LOC132741170 [Ruditapes philippinarum]|uniref:uncharacterized protein LOC132741170 n=1 Tax=Ruditapes philippinarum TaxID=129788 RepID=UPI00295AE8B1|nr:uncharacterized protein LOC132741170 [Ruditapes philippinarum]